MTVSVIDEIAERQAGIERPILVGQSGNLHFSDITSANQVDLSDVQMGDIVALVGDFDASSIATLLRLVDLKVILVPLTTATKADHSYFHDAAHVNVVIEDGKVIRTNQRGTDQREITHLRELNHAGLVLFSSGTTGRPKAILHDFEKFLVRYRTPRAALVTLSFLLFDHIGGINTLFHTLYNKGQVVVPRERKVEAVIEDIKTYGVELLPTSPTFLRMMLMSGTAERLNDTKLKMVTYGTERMDQGTLKQLCAAMPHIDFRQTYGMSELGILRVKTKARDSLFMQVGGEGVELHVSDNNVLKIRSKNRMLGYLNAESPFDENGWYDTKDIVETDGDYIRVVGRQSDLINVGGQKILPAEIERAALAHPKVAMAKAVGIDNPITGQHIEVSVEPKEGCTLDRKEMFAHFTSLLPSGLRPHRVKIAKIAVGHRFKQM